jgi:hypothetical protein
LINFRKGNKDELAKLSPEAGYADRAEIIRRHLADVFGSKNLSFLIGSGCSSYMHDGTELGIPTMGPLAAEFQASLQEIHSPPSVRAFVTAEQKEALNSQLGIDLTHEDFRKNLERLMEALMTAQQFCKRSGKADLQGAPRW